MNRYDLALTFITLADTGSVQQAAKQLYQTQAAVSKKISKLEEYLGSQLVWRHRSGAVLTELGQQYYHEAKAALQQFHQAEQLVKNQQRQPTGPLTVVANSYYAHQWIIPRLQSFLNKYPHIALTFDIAEILPNFKSHKMDILFGVGLQGDDDLMQKPIESTHYVLCAAPSYWEAAGLPTTSAQLLQHRFIAHSARQNPSCITLSGQQPLHLQPILWLNQSQAIIAAAKEGIGFIWIPEVFVREDLKHGTLVEVLHDVNQQQQTVYIYYRAQPWVDHKVSAFLDFFTV